MIASHDIFSIYDVTSVRSTEVGKRLLDNSFQHSIHSGVNLPQSYTVNKDSKITVHVSHTLHTLTH